MHPNDISADGTKAKEIIQGLCQSSLAKSSEPEEDVWAVMKSGEEDHFGHPQKMTTANWRNVESGPNLNAVIPVESGEWKSQKKKNRYIGTAQYPCRIRFRGSPKGRRSIAEQLSIG